jgi:L-amino acid N-acyltransferase YncA
MVPQDVGVGEELVVRAAGVTDLAAVAAIYAHYVEHTVVTFDLHAPSVDAWRKRLGELNAMRCPFLVPACSMSMWLPPSSVPLGCPAGR